VVAALCTCVVRQSAAAEPNAYLFDPLWVDIFDNWKPIGRTEFRMLRRAAFEPRPILMATMQISKAGQMVHGLQRDRLNLPLPDVVRFRAWMDAPYLWVVLGDKAGRRVSSRVPLPGMRPRHWCEIEVRLEETRPLGLGGEPIRDLDMIALLTRESSGEQRFSGPSRCYSSQFEAVYPPGTGPQNPTVTREELDGMLSSLPARIEEVDRLLADAEAKGVDTRYPRVSRTVLERYRGEVFSMIHPRDPLVAKRTAEYLLRCADRVRDEVKTLLDDPARAIRLPEIPLQNLRCREGSFFSGDRPVMLAGVCGWFSPEQFSQLSSMGYTSLSIEIGPRSMLPGEGETKPEGVNGIMAVMDAAVRHNMVCDLLVSPHYFPGWAREKWPSTDATGWRQKTNPFMPWTITDPHFRDVIARHLAVLVPLIRDHPALLSYDLVNEVWYRLIPDFPASQREAFQKAHPELDEWQALSGLGVQNVTEFFRWYIGLLHQHDREHPVHAKVISTEEVLSVDREAVGEVLTANGMDAMPSWPDWSGRLAADFTWQLLRHDFHRSLQPDQAILDAEYHISGGVYPMPDRYVPAALWVLALHGRDVSDCWVFGRGDDVSLYWHANGVEGLGRTALDLLRLGREVHAFQRQRSPLALYYGGIDIEDAYRACLFQDLDVGIVTDRRIRAGRLADYKVLVLAQGTELPEDVAGFVDGHVRAGRLVVRGSSELSGRRLWQAVHEAVDRAGLARPVRADRWGVECRSVEPGSRRLFYVLNHRRGTADVALRSTWALSEAVDLRTQQPVDAHRLHLEPLAFHLLEVK